MQHGCSILKLELAGQVAVGVHPNLVGVAIIKAPIWIWNVVFADLFADPDEGTLDRAIAVGPEVHLAGIKMRDRSPSGRLENRGVSPTTTRSAKLPGDLTREHWRAIVFVQPSLSQQMQ